jgi:GT2 family glycosyltransferase
VVAFTDDDRVPVAGWLEAGIAACAAAPGAVVQGRIDPLPEERYLLGPFSRTLSVTGPAPTYATANVFYPRAVLEAAGGFDEGMTTGEDTDLAWRAFDAGAGRAFSAEAQVFHTVARLGPLGKLRIAARWTTVVKTFADHPQLRREQLTYNVFWKGSHYLLIRALIALVLPRRARFLRRWLAWPYALHLLERGEVEGGGPALAPYYLLYDLIELATVLRGSLRYRTLVL